MLLYRIVSLSKYCPLAAGFLCTRSALVTCVFVQVHSLTCRQMPASLREKMKPTNKSIFVAANQPQPPNSRARIQSEIVSKGRHNNQPVTSRTMSACDDITNQSAATTTRARMQFWQQRIASGQTTDTGHVIDSFPQLASDLFKT